MQIYSLQAQRTHKKKWTELMIYVDYNWVVASRLGTKHYQQRLSQVKEELILSAEATERATWLTKQRNDFFLNQIQSLSEIRSHVFQSYSESWYNTFEMILIDLFCCSCSCRF